MEPDEKKSTKEKLETLKQDIRTLKSSLISINSEKEKSFRARNDVSSKRKSSIDSIKGLREKRDVLNSRVKDNKFKRKALNTDIKKSVEEIKSAEKNIADLKEKLDIKGGPSMIIKDLERMEYKLETSVMSFENEKKLMKAMNELKKKVAKSKDVNSLFDQKKVLQSKINVLRKQSDALHESIQKDAAESQDKHKEFIRLSKEIKLFLKDESSAHKSSMDFKSKFQVINEELQKKLLELRSLSDKWDSFTKSDKDLQKKKHDKMLKSIEEEIEAKIKRGEKLTNEDLLAFQLKK